MAIGEGETDEAGCMDDEGSAGELQWMVDLETSDGVVRAELTTDGRLLCTDDRVLKAFDVAMESGGTSVRPINSVLGIMEVRIDDPESMASFVLRVLKDADPDLGDVTFYGSRYLDHVDDHEPEASDGHRGPIFSYDTIEDEVFRSPDHPESRFGLAWPG